jgi:hypothetical protein
VPVQVLSTPRAIQQIDQLRTRQRDQFADFVSEVTVRGCAALGYRLTGDVPLEKLCVKHLGTNLRVVMAFESPTKAWVLLVGPHDDHNPAIDVYTELYELVGYAPPVKTKRRKPACCDGTGGAPVIARMAEQLADRAALLRRTRRATPSVTRA